MTEVQPLAFQPSGVVAQRLAELGRTEDVAFSPDQRRLAIAAIHQNRVLVIQVEVREDNDALTIVSDACVMLHCTEFDAPHGLWWMDDDTLVIGNRNGGVSFVPVPVATGADATVEVAPLFGLARGHAGLIESPGSVAISRLDDQYFDLLLCNNSRNHVSRHLIRKADGFEVLADQCLFRHDLQIPDGICLSRDRALVAVSNHHGQRVDVFSNAADGTIDAPPAFSLAGLQYPHGLRFALDDRLLLVADAGAPLVHVFLRGPDGWAGASQPHLSLQVIDDDSFLRGRKNPQEGGPKGLDVRSDGSHFVISCEEVPIAFFDLRPIRAQIVDSDASGPSGVHPDHFGLRDTFVSALRSQQNQIAALRSEIERQATVVATMEVQQDQIKALQAKLDRLRIAKPKRRTPDRWLSRLLLRAARKALGPNGGD